MVFGRKMVPVLLLFVAVIRHGYGWDSSSSFYQGGGSGSFGSNGGYVQSRAGADSALWNQGQYIGGEQTPSGAFGQNLPWSGNGQAVKGAGVAGSGLSGGGYNGQAGFGPGRTIAYGNDALFPPGYFQGGSNGAPQAGGFGGAVGSGPGGYFGDGNPQRPFAAPAGSVGGLGGPAGAGNGGAGGSIPGAGLGGSFGGEGSAPEARPAAGSGVPAKGIPSNPANSQGDGSAADAGTRPSGGALAGGVGPTDSQNVAGPATGADGFYGGAGFGPTGAVGKGEAPRGRPQGALGSQGTPGVAGSTGGHFGSASPGADNRVPPSIAIALPAVRPAVAYYGNHLPGPSSYPGAYGAPAELGGHGAPWYGPGYMYRVPVAHINPDGSYGFSYQTPHSNREEAGDSAGKVDGNYGFHNDGAKHNFSFSAGPDVDVRTSVGQRGGGGELNPADYGPQSIHSRSRLPLIPGTVFAGDGNDANNEVDDTLGRERPQAGSVANRNGLNGPSTASSAPSGADDSSLKVLGLPKAHNPSAVGSSGSGFNGNPNAGNQLGVVRNTATVNPIDDAGQRTTSVGADGDGSNTDATTEDSTESVNTVRGSFPANDVGRRFGYNGDPAGHPLTTSRPQQFPIEQVGSRPQNDPSYRFAYQTPTATREEAAGRDGTVRGSFSYLNEAGRNDLQYQAGAGTGFRPLGGSLAVPNGLRNGVADGPQQNVPFRFDQPAAQDGANAFGPSAGSQHGQGGLRTGANSPGIAGQAQGGFPFGSGANGNDGSAVRGSFVYNSETGRNEFIVGSGAGRRPVGTGDRSGPNGYTFGGAAAGNGLVSGGGSGFGGASGSGAFGHNGRPFNFNNQEAGGFHSSGSGGFGQASGSGLTTHNAVTRSPHDALPPNRWNTEQNAQSTATSPNGRFTTNNFDDSEQTTSFLGFGNGNEATSG